MEFIEGGTLTPELAKIPQNICQIAELMRLVHSIPKSPDNFKDGCFKENMEDFYQEIYADYPSPLLNQAMDIIRQGEASLQKFKAPSVTIHGDLNPRNILAGKDKFYFIDWSEGMFTDPFHDLAYFAAIIGYEQVQEDLLLKSYLKRPPTAAENQRFKLVKKMNLARLVLGGISIMSELIRAKGETVNFDEKLPDLSYFQRFAENDSPLSAQFFYNLARASLARANAL